MPFGCGAALAEQQPQALPHLLRRGRPLRLHTHAQQLLPESVVAHRHHYVVTPVQSCLVLLIIGHRHQAHQPRGQREVRHHQSQLPPLRRHHPAHQAEAQHEIQHDHLVHRPQSPEPRPPDPSGQLPDQPPHDRLPLSSSNPFSRASKRRILGQPPEHGRNCSARLQNLVQSPSK